MLTEIKQLYQNLNDAFHIKLGKKVVLQNKLINTQERIKELDQKIENLTKASLFLQSLSDMTRQQTIDKISTIVTSALQKVKDPNLEFKMILSTERNQPDVQFVVQDKQTKYEYDILNSCGGSIGDIITFPLRVSLLVKWEPRLARLLILDESFKFVSVQDQELLGEFIRQIAEKLQIQIILVSHSEKISSKAHKIFSVVKENNISNIEEKPLEV